MTDNNIEHSSPRLDEVKDSLDNILEEQSFLDEDIRNSEIGDRNALRFGRRYLQLMLERMDIFTQMGGAYEEIARDKSLNSPEFITQVVSKSASELREILEKLEKGDAVPAKDYLLKSGASLSQSGKAYKEDDKRVLGEKLLEISSNIPSQVDPQMPPHDANS